VGGVAHVQDDVGLGHLLQRGAEGGDQFRGNSLMKPTVSDRITLRPEGSSVPRSVGSSVAKSWFSANTPAPVSALNRVDLPALV
jgi:hypothetical protein